MELIFKMYQSYLKTRGEGNSKRKKEEFLEAPPFFFCLEEFPFLDRGKREGTPDLQRYTKNYLFLSILILTDVSKRFQMKITLGSSLTRIYYK